MTDSSAIATRSPLSGAHLAAIGRKRRVIVNYDTELGSPIIAHRLTGNDIEQLTADYLALFDEEGVEVDSIWWCWLDGNYANYPSQLLPVWQLEGLRVWWDAGIDPLRAFLEATHRRGKEAFLSYRLNGTDMAAVAPLSKPLLKEAHPEWLIHTWESHGNAGYWNFAVPEVREYKAAILRELAENYDYDGIEIDFARTPVTLPPGKQWEQHEHLTELMRTIREVTLEVEQRRRRPFLLAARIPETQEGCHFDGIDVEAWVAESLVDLLVLGNRSLDVDLPGFRKIVAGSPIKLYPCLDDHHASDGYLHPPIEVLRGVFANWWHQGADGIQTFNFLNTAATAANDKAKAELTTYQPLHRQAYREMATPEQLSSKDKAFVLQRRGGGHGPTVVPNPEQWDTPRWMYYLTNMQAPLPAQLASDGRADTLLIVYVADDAVGQSNSVGCVQVRLLLSDPHAANAPAERRLPSEVVASQAHHLVTTPLLATTSNAVEVRVNNGLLSGPATEGGWLVFRARPAQLAQGRNLVGVRCSAPRSAAAPTIVVEKLEVWVRYRPRPA